MSEIVYGLLAAGVAYLFLKGGSAPVVPVVPTGTVVIPSDPVPVQNVVPVVNQTPALPINPALTPVAVPVVSIPLELEIVPSTVDVGFHIISFHWVSNAIGYRVLVRDGSAVIRDHNYMKTNPDEWVLDTNWGIQKIWVKLPEGRTYEIGVAPILSGGVVASMSTRMYTGAMGVVPVVVPVVIPSLTPVVGQNTLNMRVTPSTAYAGFHIISFNVIPNAVAYDVLVRDVSRVILDHTFSKLIPEEWDVTSGGVQKIWVGGLVDGTDYEMRVTPIYPNQQIGRESVVLYRAL